MEYSGLRVGDAVSLSSDDLDGDRLLLDRAKTGVKVYIPLPGHVVTALRELPLQKGKYFFWPGAGKVDTVAIDDYVTKSSWSCSDQVRGSHFRPFRERVPQIWFLAPIQDVSWLCRHPREGD